MSHNPLNQAPVRLSFNIDDPTPRARMRPEWIRWFNQVVDLTEDFREFEPTLDPDDIIVAVNKPSHTAGLGIVGFRAGDNKINITFGNFTGSPIDPPSEDYHIVTLKL